MISFIGAGKVGSALGLYFKQKGLEVGGYYSRTYEHAERAAKLTGTVAYSSIAELMSNSKMVWITASDDALPVLAMEIAQLDIPPQQIKAFVHTSGVHSTMVLQPIKDAGFPIYCAHPLMAFGQPEESAVQLNEAYFTLDSSLVEEDEKETLNNDDDYLTGLFEKTGNHTLLIDSQKKELYHCAASVLSNYLVTLLNLAYEMFAKSGMTKSEIKKATAPLLNSTLKNIAENEHMSDALTGAIKRGDGSTVAKHLETLHLHMPDKQPLYKALGRETMSMLRDDRLREMLD
ncbi:MAG: DUF2520 domain-containing protein [Bacteroidales bacterium]|jgi:predicted short-subunit dehydrogenase-like oxidoreductase (DUF2520 family)|nr:DUF2520 domain-containing protein [Bacteroidales bacterium]